MSGEYQDNDERPGTILVSDLRARAFGTCRRCDSPATVLTLCDKHFAEAQDGYDRLHAAFEFLLANGMSRAAADRALCRRLRSGWEP